MGFRTSRDTINVPTVSHSDTSRPISVNNGNIINLSLLSFFSEISYKYQHLRDVAKIKLLCALLELAP